MANEIIILQIFLITLGITLFSLLFNKIFGLKASAMREFRDKAMNLQERLKNAQLMQDYQLMRQLQVETSMMMKDMMKKQMIPMCLRCFIFLGIWAVLGFIYADYSTGLLPFPIPLLGDGWFAVYFLFALSMSLIMLVIRLAYKKITGKGDNRQSFAKEMLGMMGPAQQQGIFNTPQTPQSPQYAPDDVPKPPTWKDRIEYNKGKSESKEPEVIKDETNQ